MSPPDFANGDFLIVGIGASAGGLNAFSELLNHLPIDGHGVCAGAASVAGAGELAE